MASTESTNDAGASDDVEPRASQRLPSGRGRHELSREAVEENHRNRLIWGLGIAMAEKGYTATSVQDILDHAGVSRRTFYQHFKNKDDCFLATVTIARDVMFHYALIAFEDPAPWSERVRSAVEYGVELIARRPADAKVWIVDGLEAGPAAAERYDEFIRFFAKLLHEGNELAPVELPIEVAEQAIGGIVSLIYRKVALDEVERLPELVPLITYQALVPYVGPEEAWRMARSGGS